MPIIVPEKAAVSALARRLDHTLLRAQTTASEIRRLCDEARLWGFASVCVPPRFVSLAADLLSGSPVATGTVIGFPLGNQTAECKVFEAGRAVAAGAVELDMVIAVGAALEGRLAEVEDEIAAVVATVGANGTVKVIIECCFMSDELKGELAEIVVGSGAAYVKTSSGFGSGGATLEDVRLLASRVRGRVGVKAAGGIRDLASCRAFVVAGASRIGTSNGVAILSELAGEYSGEG